MRCQTKNLLVASDQTQWVTVTLQTVPDAQNPTPATSSLNTTIAVASDTFIMGNNYAITIVDGTMTMSSSEKSPPGTPISSQLPLPPKMP